MRSVMEGHARTYGSGCASASILCGSETVDELGRRRCASHAAVGMSVLGSMHCRHGVVAEAHVRNTRDDAVPACSNRWCFRVAFRL